MTKEELAAKLNGKEYCDMINEQDKEEERQAKEAGLVIVFGASDDLMEFRGAIRDETDCYEGGIVYLDEDGIIVNECDEDCPHFEKLKEKAKKIEAIWCEGDESKDDPISWTYKTDIPHSAFEIMEDGEIYCRGIIFNTNDLS